MASLTKIDWRSLANEANIRALLEDLIGYYKGVYEGQQLALAVWFGKSPQEPEHKLLALFTGPELGKIAVSQRQSLLWKTGVDQAPFANIHATTIAEFTRRLDSAPQSLNEYREKPDVIYFDARLVPPSILHFFGIVTEPRGLIKVWFVSERQYVRGETVQSLLAARGNIRREVGLVKTWESEDFENCRALVHVEVGQRWLPSSPDGVKMYGFYSDWEGGHPGYFLAEGGAFYRVLKFEVISAPHYADLVLEKLPHDRYPEVYLRAVHPPEQPAA